MAWNLVTGLIHVVIFACIIYHFPAELQVWFYPPNSCVADVRFIRWCILIHMSKGVIIFYPTRCVISIPSPRLRDRKHTTLWIKIISHHKTWEILYIQNREECRKVAVCTYV
jgi:hypothetical protein